MPFIILSIFALVMVILITLVDDGYMNIEE
jgi:hypothetical protein